MIRVIFLLSLYYWSNTLIAQYAVPYLGTNGLYGLSSVEGEVSIDPSYDYVWHLTSSLYPGEEWLEAYAPEKGGLFGLATIDGKAVCEPVFKRKPLLRQFSLASNQHNRSQDTLTTAMGSTHFALINWSTGTHTEQAYPYANILEGPRRLPMNTYQTSQLDFHFDMARVAKGALQSNFIDVTGRELLPEDVLDGYPLSHERLAVLGSNGKLALYTTEGQKLTDFVFDELNPSGNSSYFLINTDYYHRTRRNSRLKGFVNTDGQFVVDTIYQELIPWNSELLIAEKDNAFGLINFAGETVLAFEYAYLSPVDSTRLIAQASNDRYRFLIDEQGQSYGPTDRYQRIKPLYGCSALEAHFDYGQCDILNLDGTVKFSDTIGGVNFYPHENIFRTYRRDPSSTGNQLHGIRNQDGSTILPLAYSLIRSLADYNYFAATTPSGIALYDSLGQIVLPARFDAIEYDDRLTCFWARPNGSHLYQAYNRNGDRVEQLGERLNHRIDIPFLANQIDGQKVLQLKNGSTVTADDFTIYNSYRTGTGKYIFYVRQSDEHYYLRDSLLQNVTPSGFRVAMKSRRDAVKEAGLFAVEDGYRYGVIDTEGNWVIHPTIHQYYIVAPDLILQLPHPENREGNEHSLAVFSRQADGRFQQGDRYYNDAMEELRNGWMRVGLIDRDAPGRPRMRFGYIDSLGHEVVAPQFETLERTPTNFMLTFLTDEAGERQYQIIDRYGRTRFEVPYTELYGDHDQPNQFFVRRPDGKMGMIDSTNQVIFPFTYDNLGWVTGRDWGMLRFQDKQNDQSGLVQLNGEEIARFEIYASQQACHMPGYIIMKSRNSLLVVQPDNSVLGPYELGLINHNTMRPELLLCRTPEKQRVYLNVINGRVYQE